MTEGTRWQFVGFISILVVLYFLLRVGLGLGALAPDLLVVALLLAARRMRPGQAAGLGFLLGLLDGAAHPLTMGAGAVAFSILGYLGSRSREALSGDSPVLLALYLFAGKWLYDLIVYLLLIQDHLAGPVSSLLLASPLAAAYAAAVGLAAATAQQAGNGSSAVSLCWQQHLHQEISMPVIAWLLGVPLVVILLFMLVF